MEEREKLNKIKQDRKIKNIIGIAEKAIKNLVKNIDLNLSKPNEYTLAQ